MAKLSSSRVYGSLIVDNDINADGNITGDKVYGAVYNDYAEYRNVLETIQPGMVAEENGDGSLKICTTPVSLLAFFYNRYLWICYRKQPRTTSSINR